MTDVINVGQMANDEGSGTNGWSPLFAVVEDSARRVLQLADWTGGTGTKPTGINKYLGPDGLVDAIADATDIRGAAGSGGEGGSVAWADITGKPSTFAPIIGSGSDQAVAGNDSRLTDARTPTAHTHTIGQVVDLQTALDAKVDKADGKSLSENDYTTAEKNKLAGLSNYDDTSIQAAISGLETGKANTSDLAAVATSGTYTDLTGKPRYEVLSELPADLSGYPDGSRIILEDE